MLSDRDEHIGEAAYADRQVHWALLRSDLDIRFPPSDICPLLRFGRWDDQPHQHLPASRLAASHWKGMLIADEVGLGKTISALHVLRRLHVLGERGGVLIVVPGGLRSKWMQELYHRTDLQGVEADTGAKLRQALQTIEAGEPLVVVTSHGILRQSSLVSELLENGMPEMMLSIVDEAHHVRNPNSRLHDAVQMLTLNSRNMLFLTATPINLRNEDLWVQLSLLAPDRWPDFSAFERTMRPMRQLNTALDALSQQQPDLEEARAALQILALTPGFAGDPRLTQAIELVADALAWSGEEGVTRTRREVASLLRQIRPLNDLMVRTRRRDVNLTLARRDAVTLDVGMTDAEWRLYEAARRWTLRLVRMRNPDSGRIDWALVMPERMASSCLPAYAIHVQQQVRDAARRALDFGAEGDDEPDELNLREGDRRLFTRLGVFDELLEAAEELGDVDSKYDALRVWLLDELERDPEGGILLFSHFRGTLAHLHRRLSAEGVRCEVLSGETPMAGRDAMRRRFAEGDIQVLLSSEVGSEGLDQQHCHRLVNYDLPWNPMRIEQRIGRLDRFGQQAEVITILNLAVEGTIDAAILNRLYHRIRLFEDSVGMLDPLLGRAMRLVAQEELARPLGREIAGGRMRMVEGWEAQQFSAAEGPNTGGGDVESLLIQRERWLVERANEEREWLGPDPGIEHLREDAERMELGIEPEELLEWASARLELKDPDAGFHLAGGVRQLRLSDEGIETLLERARDCTRIDGLTVDWTELLERISGQAGPNVLPFTLTREEARDHPDRILIAPWHPIIQWLREPISGIPDEDAMLSGWQDAGIPPSHRLQARRPEAWSPSAHTVVCLDWAVQGLAEHCVRRWLVLDAEGMPVLNQPERPWTALEDLHTCQPSDEDEEELEVTLDRLHGWLLDDERARLGPLLDELRHNVQQAWMGRIERERDQVAQARWRQYHQDRPIDVRWLRMKEGMISRLRTELDDRIERLDRVREGLQAELSARIVVKLEP